MHTSEPGKSASSAFLTALLFSFTVVLAAPITVHVTNQVEFLFTTAELFRTLLPAFGVCMLGLGLLLWRIPTKWYFPVLSVLFMLSFLLWLQGNILVWDYGALDGREIDWLGMWPFGLLDTAIWAAGLFLAVRYARWISTRLAGISALMLILVQLTGLYAELRDQPPVYRYQVNPSVRFSFSSDTNAIILVVDAMQSDVFQEVISEEPEVAALFDDFVYFRNAVSGFRQSYPSVPNILTGTYFDNTEPMWDYVRKAYLGPTSLPKFFRDQGWKSEVNENKAGIYFHPDVLTNVLPNLGFWEASPNVAHNLEVALFRYLPHFLKPLIYNNQLWLFSRWITPVEWNYPPAKDETAESSENLRARPYHGLFEESALEKLVNLRYTNQILMRGHVAHDVPLFKYYHFFGTHLPIRMNRDFEYVEPSQNRAALKDVTVGVLKLMGLILDQFRSLGIYEDALIVITADHGMWDTISEVKIPGDVTRKYGENGTFPTNTLPERKGTALPTVLVKRPGLHGPLVTNDAPVSLADIPRTVVSEMGFDASAFPGVSMFELEEDQPRERFVFYSTFSQNPAYSEPYRSTMTEFRVTGFSWLDKSWQKTGRLFPPPD